MTRPNSLDPYIRRYEGVMYKNAASIKASRDGYVNGQKMARTRTKESPAFNIVSLIEQASKITVPSMYIDKNLYRFSFVLGYLKQLALYDESDKEQQLALDTMIAFNNKNDYTLQEPRPIILPDHKK